MPLFGSNIGGPGGRGVPRGGSLTSFASGMDLAKRPYRSGAFAPAATMQNLIQSQEFQDWANPEAQVLTQGADTIFGGAPEIQSMAETQAAQAGLGPGFAARVTTNARQVGMDSLMRAVVAARLTGMSRRLRGASMVADAIRTGQQALFMRRMQKGRGGNVAGGALSGAVGGAGAGLALGPVGAIVGAIVGGVAGGAAARKEQGGGGGGGANVGGNLLGMAQLLQGQQGLNQNQQRLDQQQSFGGLTPEMLAWLQQQMAMGQTRPAGGASPLAMSARG